MFCIKMTTINRRAKASTKKQSDRTPSDSEFTHDFIRDVANRFNDPQTVSNMSKVSKKFNKALDLSNDKSKQRFLTEHREEIRRSSHLMGRLLPINDVVTAVYKAFPNGKREGSYQELDKDNNVVVQGNYIKGKLEGILKVINKTNGYDEIIEYEFENNELKSLTHFEKGKKIVRHDVSRKDFPDARKFEDFINCNYYYAYRSENFEENPMRPIHVVQEFSKEGSIMKVDYNDIQMERESINRSKDHSYMHETRHKNGELIFDIKQETNSKKDTFSVSCESKFLKITLSSGKGIRAAREEFFEDGEKIGELNYHSYRGYLNRANNMSDEEKSFFRGKEVNKYTIVYEKEKFDQSLRVAFVDRKGNYIRDWEEVVLGHNM